MLEIRDWMDIMPRDLGVRTDTGTLAWERTVDEVFGWWGWKGWGQDWFVTYEPMPGLLGACRARIWEDTPRRGLQGIMGRSLQIIVLN
jgi:hypothetical protein